MNVAFGLTIDLYITQNALKRAWTPEVKFRQTNEPKTSAIHDFREDNHW